MRKRPLFLIKIIAIFFIIAFLGVYFVRQSKFYLFGPQINIKYPENGTTLNSSLITVSGEVFNAVSLFVNGNQVLSDTFGDFETDLLLADGYNIISFEAKDKFGRVEAESLELVLK
jgi:hypothetical protein